MKFGVFYNPFYAQADAIVRFAQHAEALGFDSLMADDHVFPPRQWESNGRETEWDVHTILTYLAAKTSKIRLVYGCLVVPFRQPFTTAKAIASLDVLSGGRVILGVATGHLKREFATFNIRIEERGKRMDEYLRIMKGLWTTADFTFTGAYYSARRLNLNPRPLQHPHPPIWVGGSSMRAVRRAVELGDAWFPLHFAAIPEAAPSRPPPEASSYRDDATPERITEGIAYAKRLSSEMGKPYSMKVAILTGVIQVTDYKVVRPFSGKRFIFSKGNPDQVIADLRRYVDAGVEHFTIGFAGRTEESFLQQMERFAKDVLPAFR
jgi:probable F420-dependent oxidoreductase